MCSSRPKRLWCITDTITTMMTITTMQMSTITAAVLAKRHKMAAMEALGAQEASRDRIQSG
jgi:hypothetical protein